MTAEAKEGPLWADGDGYYKVELQDELWPFETLRRFAFDVAREYWIQTGSVHLELRRAIFGGSREELQRAIYYVQLENWGVIRMTITEWKEIADLLKEKDAEIARLQRTNDYYRIGIDDLLNALRPEQLTRRFQSEGENRRNMGQEN
jgi:hypothetical protein